MNEIKVTILRAHNVLTQMILGLEAGNIGISLIILDWISASSFAFYVSTQIYW